MTEFPNPLREHRNVLEIGDQIKVSYSLWSRAVINRLTLDFDAFIPDAKLTLSDVEEKFTQIPDDSAEFLNQFKEEIDPKDLYKLIVVQSEVHRLLQITRLPPVYLERDAVYKRESEPKLSQFIGLSYCIERAALAQWLLQRIKYPSILTTGITKVNPADSEEYPQQHTWLVLPDNKEKAKQLIFDVARPFWEEGSLPIPRLRRLNNPEVKMEDLPDNALALAVDIMTGAQRWYGNGKATSTGHQLVS